MPQIRHAASAKGYQMRSLARIKEMNAPCRPKSVTCPAPSLTHFLFNDLIGEWNRLIFGQYGNETRDRYIIHKFMYIAYHLDFST
jgi:hypothetical protein